MIINLLLTPELRSSKPESIRTPMNYGQISVRFPGEDGSDELVLTGDNAVLEGNEDDFIKWLKPFDGFAVGVGGSPQFEQFEIRHIAKNL